MSSSAASPMDGADAWSRTLRNAPPPAFLSEAASELMRRGVPTPEAEALDLVDNRRICAAIQADIGGRQQQAYGVDVADDEIAGVPVRVFTPRVRRAGGGEALLLNFHGGGFMKDSGSLTENIPIAGLTGLTVIAARYRLAPEHPYPAAVDDAEAVWRALLERRPSVRPGLYGTSAGAILAAQTIVRLQRRQLPLPSVLGFFSGAADFSQQGDSEHFFPLVDDPRPVGEIIGPYLDGHDLTQPDLSPLRADLSGFPPTLCITSTRDLMLSQTSAFHRALRRAGVPADLVVFEALPHAHWSWLEIPESAEAFEVMATFLGRSLGA